MLFHVSCELEYAAQFPSTLFLNVYAQRTQWQTILDERFNYALLCLERLVEHHAQSRDLSQIAETKGVDRLRRPLRAHSPSRVRARR